MQPAQRRGCDGKWGGGNFPVSLPHFLPVGWPSPSDAPLSSRLRLATAVLAGCRRRCVVTPLLEASLAGGPTQSGRMRASSEVMTWRKMRGAQYSVATA
ncbi:hypothetical protein MRX96_036894 [Rhipicephalus microplus]